MANHHNILHLAFRNSNMSTSLPTKYWILISCFFMIGETVFPPTIRLQGTVRDFSALHPDFESPANWCKQITGLYQPYLTASPDSRPITKPPQLRGQTELGLFPSCESNTLKIYSNNSIANFGQFFMDEYYQDVPGVNIAIPIDITLNLIDPQNGLYQFTSNSFFPINDKGYVTELLNPREESSVTGRVYNYWFTTEFRIRFYYRGGEVFNFRGDDDLWVFIDGKLTSCDLGSIHEPQSCSVNLDSLGLLRNSAYDMAIFHAERHWEGSTFQITTSIVPENQPPVASSFQLNLLQDTFVNFKLKGFDPDFNPKLQFKITKGPQNGILSQPIQEWLPFDQEFTYTPNKGFAGQDSIDFILNDNFDDSKQAVGVFIVKAGPQPPKAINSVTQVSLGQNASIKVEALDADTPIDGLMFSLTETPQYGYAKINQQLKTIEYEAVRVGQEVLKWTVTDGTFTDHGTTTINIVDPLAMKPLTGGQIAGIAVGGFVFLAIVGFFITMTIYNYCMAAKFQKTWEKEFYSSRMIENPLYVPATKTFENPLYRSAAETAR